MAAPQVARMRRAITGYTVAAVLGAAALALIFSTAAAQGILLGSAAGLLPFLLFSRRVERMARGGAAQMELLTLGFSYFRVALYLIALLVGYWLAPDTAHGLLGAAAGILLVRVLLTACVLAGAGEAPEPPSSE